jgi:surface carbohydrate biosynthesis protein
MILLFPIEIGNRELLAKLYLSMSFAEKGYTSYIGYKGQIWDAIPYLEDFVYFDKGYHKGISEDIYELVHKNGGKIISMDEEIGVVQKNNSTLERRFPLEILDKFQKIFLWGKSQYIYLKNRNYFPKDTIMVSGHPRFELLQAKYMSLFQSEVDKIKSKYSEYILINTSFGFGNNILGDEFVISNYIDRHPNIQEHINYEQQLIDNFISLIRKLRENFTHQIVLRPHPEESHNIYVEALADIENFHVVYDGSVIPWIIGSDVMIHHSCTTAVEAAMLGRKSIAYTKDYKEDMVSHLPLQVSHICNTDADVIRGISSKDHHPENEKTNNVLWDNFSFPSESTLNIVHTCMELWGEEQERTRVGCKFLVHLKAVSTRLKIRNLLEKIGVKRKNILGAQKRKGLDKISVYRVFNKIISNNYINRDIRIKQLSNQLYRICK